MVAILKNILKSSKKILHYYYFFLLRYDKEGHAMEAHSLTEVRGAGGGGYINWKMLSDIKTEHLGHGEKVPDFDRLFPHTCWLHFFRFIRLNIKRSRLREKFI